MTLHTNSMCSTGSLAVSRNSTQIPRKTKEGRIGANARKQSSKTKSSMTKQHGTITVPSELNLGPGAFGMSSADRSSIACHNIKIFDCGSNQDVLIKTLSMENSGEDSADHLSEVDSESAETNEAKLPRVDTTSSKRHNKRQYCPFCEVSYIKLPRHMLKCHAREKEVQHVKSLSKGSKERKEALALLRKRGNFHHNWKVCKEKSGTLVPVKRPSKSKPYEIFIPCKLCLGFYAKRRLYKHVQSCKQSNPNEASLYRRSAVAAGRQLLPMAESASQGLKENIMSSMHADNVALIAKNDYLICQFGQTLYDKHGSKPHLHGYISQKMREAARFLNVARKVDATIIRLEDCIHPTKFPSVVNAVNNLADYDSVKQMYGKPSLALKIGHILRRCAEIVEANALIYEDEIKKKVAGDFIRLCSTQWSRMVSCNALSNLQTRKYNKTERIPIAADIQKLTAFLEQQAKCLSAQLQKNPSAKIWQQFSCVILAQLVLFNRRRAGETERLLVTDLAKIDDNPVHEDILESMTKVEKKLATIMKRIEIRGKRGRKVALLIPAEHRESLNILMTYRQAVGISEQNVHVFANATSGLNRPVRASDCLRTFAQQCGAEHPQNLTSTSLRKHIATMSQLLNLRNNELDVLAKFLGHDIRIHREFYRLPQNTVEIAKVGKLLMSFNAGGKITDIDELTFSADEETDNGSVDSDSCCDDTVESEAKNKQPAGSSSCPTDSDNSQGSHTVADLSTGSEAVNDSDTETDISFSEGDLVEEVSPALETITGKIKSRKQPWTEAQKKTVFKELGRFIKNSRKLPGKQLCQQLLNDHKDLFAGRHWKNVKDFVRNSRKKYFKI